VPDVSTRARAGVETRHYPQSDASAGPPPTHHGWLAQARGREDAVGGAAAAQSGVRQRAAAAAGAVEVTR